MGASPGKAPQAFRNYDAEPTGYVREFYRRNHQHQTLAFVHQKKAQYLTLDRKRMKVWEMLEYLNDIVDESDPDTTFTQIDHALQTAEAARHANQPRWMIATGLIHDLAKCSASSAAAVSLSSATQPGDAGFPEDRPFGVLRAGRLRDPVYST